MCLEKLFQSAPCPFPPYAPLPSTSRASVAIILRVACSSSFHRHQDIESFSAWYQQSTTISPPPPEIEVLFIRRAINPNDRWSGQIAFPGGRHAVGEGDLECVHREVMEELGINLSSKRFCLLGQLPDRTMKRTTRTLVVSTLVFLQLDYSVPTEFALAEKEVADAFWCPASLLAGEGSRLGQLTLQVASLRIPSKTLHLSRLLGIHTLYFPCLYLKGGLDPEYALWGLTLSMVSDLLEVAALPSLKLRRQTELAPLPLSQTTVPFLTNSRLANVLVTIFYTRRLSREGWMWIAGVLGVAAAATVVCTGSLRNHRINRNSRL